MRPIELTLGESNGSVIESEARDGDGPEAELRLGRGGDAAGPPAITTHK